METWSLSDYVAKLDIVYPKKKENSHKERNDDNLDINELEDEDESVLYCDEGDFPLRMRNGIMLRRRSKNKVIRFRSYRQKGDPENYCRERLMLYIPWRKEEDIQGKFGSYEEAYRAQYDKIKEKMKEYEPMAEELESVDEELHQEAHEHDPIVAPSTQHDNDIQGDADPSASHDLAFYEPDHTSPLHQFDIGPYLGMAPVHTERDDVDLIPNVMTDEKYYELLGQLNTGRVRLIRIVMSATFSFELSEISI